MVLTWVGIAFHGFQPDGVDACTRTGRLITYAQARLGGRSSQAAAAEATKKSELT